MPIAAVTAGQVIDPTTFGNAVADAINPTAWTDVAFQNSWVNFGSGQQEVEYRKINDVCFVRGHMKAGASGTVCFTLPVGFRPPANFNAPTASGGAAPVAGLLAHASATGQVTYFGGGTTDVSFSYAFSITA